MNVVLLSRVQFAMTIMFHYLFPPLTIGMGVVLAFLEGRYMWTGDKRYHAAARFWTGIFALNFAIGVATGIVMEFQFGTNWANYSRFVGDVFGSALAAEGVFAFFLESGFLAVLVFGWDKVSKRMHFFSTCMVSLGSIFSSIWIVVANSWQQTPAGFHVVQMMRDGKPWFVGGKPVMRAEITDFWAMVFNPSTVERLTHVLIGCFIMGGFFVMSISAWYILKNRHLDFAKRSFRGGLLFATVFSLAALVSGDLQAKNVYRTQPAKLAAFEGHYQSGPGDLTIIGIPRPAENRIAMQVSIPGGLSILLFGDPSKSMIGTDQFNPRDRPPTIIPFFTWRIMVGVGTFFIALTLLACFLLWRGTLFQHRWLMWVFVASVLGAVAANQAGWVSAEVGRQPWTVYPPAPWTGKPGDSALQLDATDHVRYDESLGLRTEDSVSRVVSGGQVLGSIFGFAVIYLLLFLVWVFVLNHKIQKGPEDPSEADRAAPRPLGFLSAAVEPALHRESLTEAHSGSAGEP